MDHINLRIIHLHNAMYNVSLLQKCQVSIARLILASTARTGVWMRNAIVVGPATLRKYTYVLGCETECV